MSRIKMTVWIVTATLALAVWAGTASAQDQNQPNQAQQRRQRGQQRANSEEFRARIAEFRERANQRMRERLGASEDEWKVLGPKIEKVTELSGRGRGFSFGAFGRGRGGPGGNAGNQTPPPDEPATVRKARELREALDDENTNTETIKRLLKELREARAKNEKELEAARKDLRSVVTVRQEAVLVSLSLLD